MRKMIVALAGVSLSWSGAVLAAPSADQAAANRVESHVRFLADDLLEGRDTGSRGHEIAAA